ncbi:MAG: GNAT family N-acetyltransferase [Acidimicrobiales bacterium]
MASTEDEPPIEHQPRRHRFAVVVDGHEAEIVYRRRGATLELVHTGVPEEIGGRGISGRLVEAAVAYAASEGLTVRPTCPTARAWLEHHPEVAETVTVDWDDR